MFNDGQTVEAYEERKAKEIAKGYNGNGGGTPLAMAVRLWPTATMTDCKAGGTAENWTKESGRHSGTTLTDAAVRLWPTPDSSQSGGPRVRRPENSSEERGPNFHQQVYLSEIAEKTARAWPTPATRDYKGENLKTYADRGGMSKGEQLPNFVRFLWTTPRASDGEKGGPNQSWGAGGTPLSTQARHSPFSLPDLTTPPLGSTSSPASPDSLRPFRLNPAFVEWLMGLPIGWTSFEPWAMESYLYRQRTRLLYLLQCLSTANNQP